MAALFKLPAQPFLCVATGSATTLTFQQACTWASATPLTTVTGRLILSTSNLRGHLTHHLQTDFMITGFMG